MNICVAQTKPVKGNIEANILNHLTLIDQALEQQADVIVFPELSLTGYEPELADELAIDLDDSRLVPFQEISNTHKIVICVGVPTRSSKGIHISLVIFQPNQERSLYSKQYLHEDEEPFFVPGPTDSGIIEMDQKIALAICYELTIPEHEICAAENEADIYIASVAKTAKGVEGASERLSNIAKANSMTVFMSNCVGPCDGDIAGGRSAVWDKKGGIIERLDSKPERVLVIDC